MTEQLYYNLGILIAALCLFLCDFNEATAIFAAGRLPTRVIVASPSETHFKDFSVRNIKKIFLVKL
jgi:hypothetical protein